MTDKKRDIDQSWDEKSVEWRKLAFETVSRDDAPNQLLIRSAGIRLGDSVLDLASGTGEPAISIALHVGAAGHVTATDLTSNMLATARERAERLDLGNMGFEVCPMEELPFGDRTFDAVTCRFGVMHASDPLAALKEAKRVLRPGRTAAFMIHGPSGANTLWTTVHTVAPTLLQIDDSKRVEHHFKFSEGAELADLFRTAGFVTVGEEQLRRTDVRSDGEPFWKPLLTRDYGKLIESLDETRRATLYERVAAAFEQYRKDDAYELLTSQRVIFGTAP